MLIRQNTAIVSALAFAGNMVATGVRWPLILGVRSEARRALIACLYVRKAQRHPERGGETTDNMIDLSRPPVSRTAS
jgi:hypothetical protein